MISKQATINEWKNDFKGYINALNIPKDDYNGIMEYIDELPSVQRNARVFQGIVVEYPSISAYPEYEGKPYFLIKYTKNGKEFIGYGTYKPEVLSKYLKEYFMLPAESGWIPCTPETMPQEDGEYLVTIHWKNGGYYTDLLRYRAYLKEWKYEDEIFGTVVAWQPKPQPWEGDING